MSQVTRDSLNRLRSISRKSSLGGSILSGGVVMSTGGVPRITFELAEAVSLPLNTYTTYKINIYLMKEMMLISPQMCISQQILHQYLADRERQSRFHQN